MLEGKRIIVTGSARGMGAATLSAYVTAGAEVVGMDINDELGRQVAETAVDSGPGSALYMHLDVAERASVERAFSAAAERMGGLDVLAHPAAIQAASNAAEVSVEHWDQMFAVNVRGTMLTNQIAYRFIKAAGGRVYNQLWFDFWAETGARSRGLFCSQRRGPFLDTDGCWCLGQRGCESECHLAGHGYTDVPRGNE